MNKLLKLLLALPLVLLCCTLTACSDDDDKDLYPSDLIGKWIIESGDNYLMWEFTKDGTFIETVRENGDVTKNFNYTYQVNGSELRINSFNEKDVVTFYRVGDYHVRGDIFTFEYEDYYVLNGEDIYIDEGKIRMERK